MHGPDSVLHRFVLARLELSFQAITPQAALPLATQGVLRYVWEGRFGEMLNEVVDGMVYVSGQQVEPALGSSANGPRQTGDSL